MSQNRVLGFAFITEVAPATTSLVTSYEWDELAVEGPTVGSWAGATVTLSPAIFKKPRFGTAAYVPTTADGDRIVIKDVSGDASSGHPIVIQTDTNLSPRPQILSPSLGAVNSISITAAYHEITLTFDDQQNAWLSNV